MRELKHEEIADFPKDPNVGDIVVTLLAKLEHYPAATADFFDPKVASIHIIGNLHQGGDEKHGDFLIWRMGTDVHVSGDTLLRQCRYECLHQRVRLLCARESKK